MKMKRKGREYDENDIAWLRTEKERAEKWLIKNFAETDYQSVERHKRTVDEAHEVLTAWERRMARSKP